MTDDLMHCKFKEVHNNQVIEGQYDINNQGTYR